MVFLFACMGYMDCLRGTFVFGTGIHMSLRVGFTCWQQLSSQHLAFWDHHRFPDMALAQDGAVDKVAGIVAAPQRVWCMFAL